MSETEDDDGGIDKEALREELREKYEGDDTEREATQRMSDLLLKGATMTNSHCHTCGDPLFRQNGTTFCPSCHGGPEGVEASPAQPQSNERADDGSGQPAPGANGQTETGANGQTETGANGQASNARSEGAQQPGTQAGDATTDDATNAAPSSTGAERHAFDPEPTPTNPDGRSIPEPGNPTDSSHASDRTPSNVPGDRRGPAAPAGAADRPAPSRPADGDLDAAAASLAVALERFSREAAAADDPRYARDCLEAAREAADALTALRR